jgi:hypothetical protein
MRRRRTWCVPDDEGNGRQIVVVMIMVDEEGGRALARSGGFHPSRNRTNWTFVAVDLAAEGIASSSPCLELLGGVSDRERHGVMARIMAEA